MIDFARYFLRGVKNTLRVQNGVNFSYKGPWIQIIGDDTVMDEWFIGDFSAAEYTIMVDVANDSKEILKALVLAGPDQATITVYGRTNLTSPLLDLTARVDNSKVTIVAQPIQSIDGSTVDNSSLLQGGKLIFSATYFYTLNDLNPF